MDSKDDQPEESSKKKKSISAKPTPKEAKPLNLLHQMLKISLVLSMIVDSTSTLNIGVASVLPPIANIDENTPLHVVLVHAGVAVLSVCQIGLMLFIAFALIQWMYRCYLNLEFVKQKGLSTTSSWTIIWWFVPVYNWIRPYSMMKEIYLASATAGEEPDLKQKGPDYMKIWWACWVIQGLLGRSAELLMRYDPSSIIINFLSIGSNIFEIGAAVYLLKVLKVITEIQNKRIPGIQVNKIS